jgi:hypothetical protein
MGLVLLGSALAWGLLFVLVPPARANFPLIDDWAFGQGAFRFARGEGVYYGGWASMPQLGQWLWACPFVWLFGESYPALRLATVVLSWLGLWAFYDLLRQEDWPPSRAALAAAALAANPLFFLLQGTFMTDVPALSLSLVALALYGRARSRRRAAWLAAACAVALLAVTTRQTALTVPAAAALLAWRDPALRPWRAWWAAVLLPAAAGVVTHLWFQQRLDVIPVPPRVLAPYQMLVFPFVLVHWCGLSALPVLLADGKSGSWRAFGLAALLLLLCAGYWLYQFGNISDLDGVFPYTGCVVTPWGVTSGDLTVGDRPVVLGWGVRALLTALGCTAGAALILRGLGWRRAGAPPGLLLLFSALQVPFVLIAPAVWDRYLLAFLPGALFLAGQGRLPSWEGREGRLRRGLGIAAVAVAALVSVALAHDWLAWNAASWELGSRAIAHQLDPLDIEGGMEWDGSHYPHPDGAPARSWRELMVDIERKAGGPRGLTVSTTRVWFPRVTGRFALSFSPVPGAVVLDSEPYSQWLVPGERRMFLVGLPAAQARASPPDGGAPR